MKRTTLIIPDVSTAKVSKKTVNKLKTLLPTLLIIGDPLQKSPSQVLDDFSLVLVADAHKLLKQKDRVALRAYLKRWGIEDFTQE